MPYGRQYRSFGRGTPGRDGRAKRRRPAPIRRKRDGAFGRDRHCLIGLSHRFERDRIEPELGEDYNGSMTPKLTDEQRVALAANPGKPLRVEDGQTHKIYLVLSEESLPTLWEDYIRREVARGLAAADRGDVEDWDVDSIKSEGRQILQGRRPRSS